METTIWAWLGFLAFIGVMLMLDLGVFHRKARSVGVREALGWSIVWVLLAGCFGLCIRHMLGGDEAIDFYTGYLIEYSLSMDNIFVFVLIFSYFKVPLPYQHRVLVWGILGALVLRGLVITGGTALVNQYAWALYFFGALLVYSGYKMATAEPEDASPETNLVLRAARHLLPVTAEFEGARFFVRADGRLKATPLFLVLLMIESSDVVFAVDSIPAIFAVTTDTFIVFTANIFAILGLRSMYFLLASLVPKFRYLNFGLSVVLAFVGIKMLIVEFYDIPTEISLMVILLAIGGSIAVSLIQGRMRRRADF